MKTLKVRTGLVALDVIDDFGNSRGTFKFAPADTNVFAKIVKLQEELPLKEAELKDINANSSLSDTEKMLKANELVNFLLEKIDDIYGKGTSLLLFGDTHDSLLMFSDFFDGIMPEYEKARKNNTDKYLQKYRGGK